MPKQDDDGGPAFPLPAHLDQHGNLLPEGMSLHDHFAGLAMHAEIIAEAIGNAAILAVTKDFEKPPDRATLEYFAEVGHNQADAMIAEMRRREKNDAK